jgi:hypothetical protein
MYLGFQELIFCRQTLLREPIQLVAYNLKQMQYKRTK